MRKLLIFIFCILFLIPCVQAVDWTRGTTFFGDVYATITNLNLLWNDVQTNSTERLADNSTLTIMISDINEDAYNPDNIAFLNESILNGTYARLDNNNIFNANITISNENYLSGFPINGDIGSGILNSSRNKIHCGCINVSDETGLDVMYPDLKVRIWNYGDVIHCNIPGDTVAVTDNQHSVYYVDSDCLVVPTR